MENSRKIAEKFICEFCDYKCLKKSDYNKHILTDKHKNRTNSKLADQKIAASKQFICKKCNKIYTARNSLWYHEQKCKLNIPSHCYDTPSNKLDDKDDVIVMLLKQNSELMELLKNGTNNTNITHTNSHNKAFNLNFFLNETCKDAMNITDFVDSIKLELNDLERVGEIGYVEGISNIIIKNLNALDETKRPLHCTDKKRETIYIKDQGQWEKEDENKTKLKKAINKIAHKNIKLISQFREKYPDCKKCDSQLSDKYNKMIIEAMGGSGDNNVEKEEKIIRNITKATTISQK